MRILQIVHSLPFFNQAGTEVYTYNLCSELSRKHKVHIFARICDTKQKDYEINKRDINGITVYLINNTFRYCNSFDMHYDNKSIDKKFTEILDEIMPDVVHIQHLVFLSVGLIKIIRDKKIPVVFTLHDYWLMCPKWHILKEDLTPCDKAFTASFDKECPNCLSEMLNIKKGAKRIYLLAKRLLPDFALSWLKNAFFLCMQSIHDNDSGINKLQERYRRIGTLLNNTDFFIAPSEYLKKKFIEFGIPTEKIRLSHNALDSDLFRDIQKCKTNDKIRFAFIGTILPAKGIHILIESFNNINSDEAELKIYGKLYPYAGFEYYPSYLKKLIKNTNIRFMGEFTHLDIVRVLSQVDVLVVPSVWYENSPLVIKEAFLSKTPVIASRIGGIPELVTDDVNGLLFNPSDANDLRNKIQYIIDNRAAIERFKENMPRIKSIKDNAAELQDIYSMIIAGKDSRIYAT